MKGKQFAADIFTLFPRVNKVVYIEANSLVDLDGFLILPETWVFPPQLWSDATKSSLVEKEWREADVITIAKRVRQFNSFERVPLVRNGITDYDWTREDWKNYQLAQDLFERFPDIKSISNPGVVQDDGFQYRKLKVNEQALPVESLIRYYGDGSDAFKSWLVELGLTPEGAEELFRKVRGFYMNRAFIFNRDDMSLGSELYSW